MPHESIRTAEIYKENVCGYTKRKFHPLEFTIGLDKSYNAQVFSFFQNHRV